MTWDDNDIRCLLIKLSPHVRSLRDLRVHSPLFRYSYYRNIIAGSPPGKRIYIFFEKIRFASQKLNFSIFVFQQKISKNDLKQLRNNKMLQNLIYSIFVFSVFKIFYFFTFLKFQNYFWTNLLWYYGTLLNSLKLRGKTPIRSYVHFVSQNLIKNPFVQSVWYDMWAMMLNPPPQLPGCFFTCSNYWSTSQAFDLQVKKLVKSKYQPLKKFIKMRLHVRLYFGSLTLV